MRGGRGTGAGAITFQQGHESDWNTGGAGPAAMTHPPILKDGNKTASQDRMCMMRSTEMRYDGDIQGVAGRWVASGYHRRVIPFTRNNSGIQYFGFGHVFRAGNFDAEGNNRRPRASFTRAA